MLSGHLNAGPASQTRAACLTSLCPSARLGPDLTKCGVAHIPGGAMKHWRRLRLSAVLALGVTAAATLAAGAGRATIEGALP